MTHVSRVPEENLPLADHIMALAQDPAPAAIAVADQIAAFKRDQEPMMRAVAAREPTAAYADVAPTRYSLAWEMAVEVAAFARAHIVCIHFAVEPPKRDQIAFVELTLGIVTCRDCFAAAIAAAHARTGGAVPDDGHCDTCDRPETEFMPFNAQVGFWIVSGNQCASCAHAMMGGDDGAG